MNKYGDEIPLPDSSQRFKGVKLASIEEKWHAGSGDAAHNQPCQTLREVKSNQNLVDKTPLKAV